MNIKQILHITDLASLDRELLLSLALKRPKVFLYTHLEYELTSSEYKKFANYADRRKKGEPVAYIAKKKEFFGLDFAVNKNVLIPRPETEMMVQAALERILPPLASLASGGNYGSARLPARQRIRNIIDIGTGSGNIIISIAKKIPPKIKNKANFYALDISKKALYIAKKNARKHKTEKSIKFVESDLFGYFQKKKIRLNNMIILANLPYVSPKIYKANQKYLRYEPKTALVSGEKGLAFYIRLLEEIKKLSAMPFLPRRQAGALRVSCFFEISPEQKIPLARIIEKRLPGSRVNFSKDLAGRWRMAEICLQ